jgi:hypothetical protein
LGHDSIGVLGILILLASNRSARWQAWWPCVPLASLWVVFTLSLVELIANVHKSVDRSLFQRKMIFPSYIMPQLVLVKTTLHPALHSTLIPIKDDMDSLGTTCPTNTVGSPGMVMLQVCVDLTLLPSGKFMVSGCIAGHRFWTGVPSITKIEVAPISAIACDVAIVIALRYCGKGAPNRCRAAAAIFCLTIIFAKVVGKELVVQFEVTIVLSSSTTFIVTLMIWVGSEENAETKWLHLCAIMFSAPPCRNPGNFVLCINLVHGSHPLLMYLFALARTNPSGWLGMRHAVGHVMNVCLSLMSKPHE